MDLHSLEWDGITIGTLGHDLMLEPSGVAGFGRGLHRLAVTERLAGGSHLGTARRGARSIEVECWTDQLGGLAGLVERMEERTDPLPLRWRGLGWGDRELACWVVPTAVDFDVVESVLDDVVDGVRCQWVAPDPTVYDAVPTSFSGSASSSSVLSVAWENPGRGVPPAGLGGRAWTFSAVASGTVSGIWIDQGPGTSRVEFRGVAVPGGSTLTVGPDRVPTVKTGATTRPVLGQRLVSGAWVPDPIWPRFRGSDPSRLRIGCTTGSLAVSGEFRGTWS